MIIKTLIELGGEFSQNGEYKNYMEIIGIQIFRKRSLGLPRHRKIMF